MASKMLLRSQPLRSARPFAQPHTYSAASSRSFVSVTTRSLRQQSLTIKRAACAAQRSALRQPFRRHYAENRAPQVTLSPAANPPKRRWGFFRTIWRITYISVLGSFAYLAYTIYDAGSPQDQMDPDPSKKTLVILGMCTHQPTG